MTDKTFLRWRKLRAEYDLSSDDMLAQHLLDSVGQDFSVSVTSLLLELSLTRSSSLRTEKVLDAISPCGILRCNMY